MCIDAMLAEIDRSHFFSTMGTPSAHADGVIYIPSLREVFITPNEPAFQGFYQSVEWLPTAPTQSDPFYTLDKPDKSLVDLRLQVNRAVMKAMKDCDSSRFVVDRHDFSLAAKNAIGFAFRQYVSERCLGLGHHWERVVALYVLGHWPVGHAGDTLIVV